MSALEDGSAAIQVGWTPHEACDIWSGPCCGGTYRPALSPGVRVCKCGLVRTATCSFCGFQLLFTGAVLVQLSAWHYFGAFRCIEPRSIDVHDPHGERVEWLCCPGCLAESSAERITAYLDEPLAMHPTPAYRRTYNGLGDPLSEEWP